MADAFRQSIRQNRLTPAAGQPKVDWGATSTKKPRPKAKQGGSIPPKGPPQSPGRTAAAAGQPIGGPQQPVGGMTGPSFATRGRGKYYNPGNASGQQFNWPGIRQAAGKILDAHMAAQYYKHAGLVEGMRGALGMQPKPSHVNDWIIGRHVNQTNPVTGLVPGPLHGSP